MFVMEYPPASSEVVTINMFVLPDSPAESASLPRSSGVHHK
jgi:hypothetical protein